jgi:hypothetical protein
MSGMSIRRPNSKRIHLFVIGLGAVLLYGCQTLFILPLGAISAIQLFDEPNFTMRLSVESAVSDPAAVTSVNWVFGDDTGFTMGGITITHRYLAGGQYRVTAYIFGANGLLGEISSNITVIVPSQATQPVPSNGAVNIPVLVTLMWSAGQGTPFHDVYLGTDPVVIDTATTDSPEFLSRQGETFFTPAVLAPSTVYFWRIDEVRTTGITKGTIWSFITAAAPGAADDFDPPDGATDVDVKPQLTWTSGAGATSQDVYFGTDFDGVDIANRQAPEFRGNQTTLTFSPGTLDPITQYFWRIDSVGPGGTTRGDVLSFTTAPLPDQISDPMPADGATDVELDTELSWTAGANTASHDVYLGTSELAVSGATRTSPEFRGNQEETTFDPSPLTANTTYFWRIDEVGPGGTTKGDVFSFATAEPPGQATDPDPENGEQGVDLQPTLKWTAGDGATSHDVYLGTSSSVVENATQGSVEFKGNQTETEFTPADALPAKTAHFWRIDSVGPGGTTKGQVFNFTTLDEAAARDPDPPHKAEDVPDNQVLTWTPGDGAASHDVYFGTNEQAVTNATHASNEFQGNFPLAMFTPTLEAGTTYFWRIDEVGGNGTVKGLIWQFTTQQTPPEQATNPDPAHNATDVAINKSLSWNSGDRAESHDVYFGTDETAVTNATTASPEFKGNRTNASYNPGALTRSTTYFWRIDEKNSAGTTTGDVWSFTTVPPAPTKATNPSPPHNAVDQNVNDPDLGVTVLTWTPGAGAGTIRHDVYFGTNQTAVTNATTASPEFKGNRANASYDPGKLDADRDYFWRIDEVNAGGTTKGDVWRFTTAVAPSAATAPSPANNAQNIATPISLSWTAGTNVTSHDVYFGTSLNSVNNATRASNEFRSNQAGTSFNGPFGVTIQGDTQYFWRIDEIGDGGILKGTVWNFRTAAQPPGQASAPNPTNGAMNVSTSVTSLTWTAGTGATSHRVYFGTDQTDVQNRDASVFQGQINQTTLPVSLNAATQYFWVVDEVNSAGTTDGVVWTFTTQ